MRPSRLGAAIVLTMTAAGAGAQERRDYGALVRAYASGQGRESVAAVVGFTRDEISMSTRAAATALSPRLLVSAAILETEAALAIVDSRPFDAAFHVDVARTLLRSAARDPATRESVNAISRRWYYFVATVFVSAGQMQPAAWYISEGLLEFPGDAALYFARGTIAERMVQVGWQRDLRRSLPEIGLERTRIETLLKRAMEDYQKALSLDRNLAAAHLHLGWARLYLGDNRARGELEAAAAANATSRVRYLAHLFLGGLGERQKKYDEARAEYESALQAAPEFQTAYIALSRAEEALGHTGRARELAETCAQLSKTESDPWWDFMIAFDRDTLEALRTEARRQ